MIRLIDIDETNFFAARALSLHEDQRRFLDSPLGILLGGTCTGTRGHGSWPWLTKAPWWACCW